MLTNLEVAIPVLNEESRLEKGVRSLHQTLLDHKIEPKIVIADNGSKDRTLEISKRLSESLGGVRYLTTPQPGVGLALKTAWLGSPCEWVGYVDVDHSTNLSHFSKVRQCIELDKHSVCTGSRLLEDSHVQGRSLRREISSRAFNFILKEALSVNFSDGMCGFKFIKKNLFQEIQNQFSPLSEGWFFNTEILVKAEWLGHSVFEIPVHWTDDSDSRVKILKLAKEYLGEIHRLTKERHHADL